MIWKTKNGNMAGCLLKLDPSKKPRALDMVYGLGPCHGALVIQCIYSVQDDNLRICIGEKERPKDFVAKPESQDVVIVFRRVTK